MVLADDVLTLAVMEADLPAFIAAMEAKIANAERSDNHKSKAVAMFRAADALNLQQEPNKAMSQVNEALEMFEDLRFDLGRGAAQALIARICAAHGGGEDDTELAFDAAQDAVRLFRKLNSKRGEAVALYTSALVEKAFGRPERMQQCAKEAMALFREVGATAEEALACRSLADGYLVVGECRHAAAAIKKALEINTMLGDKKKQADCLKELANIEVIDGTPDKAREAFSAARTAFRAINDFKGEAEVMNAERAMLLAADRFAEALQLAKEIVTLYHQAGDRRAEGRALIKISEMLLTNNDLARAAKVAEVSLGILSEVQDAEGMKEGMEMLGALKQAHVKNQMMAVVDLNRDFMHVPKTLVVEPGLNKRIQAAYAEASKQGLF